MDDADAIEPFGFFTIDALRAGWYLLWRQMIRVVPAAAGAVIAGSLVGRLGGGVLGSVVSGFGLLAAAIWASVLIPRLTVQWAEQWYGLTPTGAIRIWWAVVWRASLASLVAAVICTPPNFVALSLSTAYPSSALGMLGHLLTLLLGVANFGVTMLATGWAMSKVTAAQSSTVTRTPHRFARAMETGSDAVARATEPELVVAPVAIAAPAPVPPPVVARPAAAPAVPRPAFAPTEGKRQCPKCGLYETERGSVIGWYCKVCGWRAGR